MFNLFNTKRSSFNTIEELDKLEKMEKSNSFRNRNKEVDKYKKDEECKEILDLLDSTDDARNKLNGNATCFSPYVNAMKEYFKTTIGINIDDTAVLIYLHAIQSCRGVMSNCSAPQLKIIQLPDYFIKAIVENKRYYLSTGDIVVLSSKIPSKVVQQFTLEEIRQGKDKITY